MADVIRHGEIFVRVAFELGQNGFGSTQCPLVQAHVAMPGADFLRGPTRAGCRGFYFSGSVTCTRPRG
jgi:hypothetical protein